MYLTQSTLVSTSSVRGGQGLPSTQSGSKASAVNRSVSGKSPASASHASYMCEWELNVCCRARPVRLNPSLVRTSTDDVLCGRAFESRSALLMHLLQAHTPAIALERCHQCHWHGCNTAFRNSSSYLRRHHFKSHVDSFGGAPDQDPVGAAALGALDDDNDSEPPPSPCESPASPDTPLTPQVPEPALGALAPAPRTAAPLPPADAFPAEVAIALAKLPDMIDGLQTFLSSLSAGASTHALRAVLDRLDTLQDTFHRYHLEWRAHRAQTQKNMKEIETNVDSLGLTTAQRFS